MGGSQSLASDVCLDDFLADLGNLYPNIEVQLEDAYVACTGCDDLEAVNQGMEYEEVEPIMRHFLFNLGFGEYLNRFCDPETGKLDPNEIKALLKRVGISFNASAKLNLDDWKILLVAWVRRCQEESVRDHQRWMETVNDLQLQQSQSLGESLRGFEKAYLQQIEAYHRAVEAQFKEEEQLRRQWESQQEAKERFHDSQMAYLEDMNRKAATVFANRLVASQNSVFVDAVRTEATKLNVTPLDGAQKAFTFIYPSDKISTGAPISGGAVLPRRVARGRL